MTEESDPRAPSLQMVLEHSPDVITVMDRELRVIYVNKALARNVAEVIGRSALDFIPQKNHQATIEAVTRVFTTGVAQQVQIESASGYVWDSRLAPIRRGDEIIAVMGINTDVTHRKRLEELSLQTQKLDALGRVTAGIAHNFNNLLQVIQTNLSLALAGAPPALEASLGDADLAARRAVELVRELMVFASGEKSDAHMQATDLVGLVARTVAMSRATLEGIALDLSVEGEVLPVRADPGRIEHVLLNVLLNARDALEGQTDPAPRVELLIDSVTQQVGFDLPARKAARIRVRDNGPGVPEELRSRVFEPFFTTKPPHRGTGLGLATAFGTMIDHGGTITCDTSFPRGATFTLLFPSEN